MQQRSVSAGEPWGIRSYTYLSAIFIGLLTTANVIAVKPISVGPFTFPAATLTYALTFLVTDTIAEIWGKEWARRLVWSGFIVSLLSALFIRLAIALPGSSFWEDQPAFQSVLGANARVVFGSMVAYLISQMHDVWAFQWWRQKTRGRHLWLRNTASTLVSQLIDTSIFISIAFYGVWGGIDALIPAIIGQYSAKVLIAFADTPLIYAAVAWVRRVEGPRGPLPDSEPQQEEGWA